MLFYIANLGILADIETVDTIMLAVLITAVVDAAAGYDKHFRVITHIEIKADTTTAGEYSRVNVGGYLLSK